MARRKTLCFTFSLLCLLIFGRSYGQPSTRPAAKAPEVDVILWFDTEDYISPSDDDADKRLAELLTQRHIRATFKVVGEKARVLERHGRRDVIEALKPHDIGFHGNFHSVHPTVSEYEADCGLLDGIAEFVRREGPGAADVRRVFGLKSLVCYGQPGASWAPQAIAALPQCGIANAGGPGRDIPCYVDSGDHVAFGGRPFWYEGALVVYGMGANETRMDLFSPGGLERGERAVSAVADRLAREGGGLISIYYHPCEWVTRQFWDAPNFSHGDNPPREQWKLPAQRTPEEAEQAYARFAAYIDHIHGLPGVRFVTASQLPQLYPDRARTEGASASEITEMASRMLRPDFAGLDVVEVGGKAFSPADQFDLLTRAVARQMEQQAGKDESPARAAAGEIAGRPLIPQSLLGPDAEPPAEPAEPAARPPVSWPGFRSAVLDVQDYLRTNRRVPSRVFLGPDPVPPADFLIGLAGAWVAYQHDGHFPEAVPLGRGVELLTARRVAKDDPKVFGGWVIHKPGFRAPKILEVARLQAWTLKPAVPAR